MTFSTITGVPTSNRGFQYPESGLNNTMEYMASGLPYSKHLTITTGSVQQVQFPYVTNELYLKNDGAGSLAVGWTENGVLGDNKYVMASGESVTLRVRVKSLFLVAESGSCATNVTAGLTMIRKYKMPVLTGSQAGPDGCCAYITGSNDPVFGYDGLG